MATRNGGALAICPYYLDETPCSIHCDALLPDGHKMITKFDTPELQKNWLNTHCYTFDYYKCPIAIEMEKK